MRPPMFVFVTQDIFALRSGEAEHPTRHEDVRAQHSDRCRPRCVGDDDWNPIDDCRSPRIGLLSARRAYNV